MHGHGNLFHLRRRPQKVGGPMIAQAIFTGVAATAFMDLVGLVRGRLSGGGVPDYRMLGRWIGHMPNGRLIHRPIAASPPVTQERALGWIMHYLIGVTLAAGFLLAAGTGAHLSPLWPVGFGVLTVIAPFAVMQPGMGAGFASRCMPRPWGARRRSLVTHLTFGIGLWLAGWLWAAIG